MYFNKRLSLKRKEKKKRLSSFVRTDGDPNPMIQLSQSTYLKQIQEYVVRFKHRTYGEFIVEL